MLAGPRTKGVARWHVMVSNVDWPAISPGEIQNSMVLSSFSVRTKWHAGGWPLASLARATQKDELCGVERRELEGGHGMLGRHMWGCSGIKCKVFRVVSGRHLIETNAVNSREHPKM